MTSNSPLNSKRTNYNKTYYAKKKEAYMEKEECECGGTITYTHAARHRNSIKHRKYFNLEESPNK